MEPAWVLLAYAGFPDTASQVALSLNVKVFDILFEIEWVGLKTEGNCEINKGENEY